jgi:hypothetical protein
MKKRTLTLGLLLLATTLLLNSCGLNMGFLTDKVRTSTHVDLSKKNFKVLDRVSGTSSATYVLGFGGMKNKDLTDMAMNDLLSKANLNGGAKALANTTVDVHKGGLPFLYSKITVKISAHVIEFTE